MTQQKFLFISYGREDGAFALRLAQDLREAGVAIWMDKLDIPSGARWDTAIQQALDACASMLVILSPASVNSENVLDEIGFALHKKKHIVPVLFRICDIPFRLLRFQYVDCSQDYEQGLRELLEDLEKMGLVAPRPTKPVTPQPPAPPLEKVGAPEQREPAPRAFASSIQKTKKALAWQRYVLPLAVIATLAFVIWKGRDWTSSSPTQEPPVTKKAEDSSATKREGQTSAQPNGGEQPNVKKQENTSTETKRENKPATPITNPERRETSRVPTMPPGMVFIRGGAFLMGSDDSDSQEYEKPLHTVIVNDFYLDEHEVTVAEYQRFLNATNHRQPENWNEQQRNPDHPVVYVNWHDAKAYAKWAGKRLPTEAEWEYAARGGNTGLNDMPHYKFPWGDNANANLANFDADNSRGYSWEDAKRYLKKVKSYPANGFGLYDMAGNVWEWCEDWYDASYYKNRLNPDRNPKGPSTGQYRVLRGGSWSVDPRSLRCALRGWVTATLQCSYVGLRCAQDALR